MDGGSAATAVGGTTNLVGLGVVVMNNSVLAVSVRLRSVTRSGGKLDEREDWEGNETRGVHFGGCETNGV